MRPLIKQFLLVFLVFFCALLSGCGAEDTSSSFSCEEVVALAMRDARDAMLFVDNLRPGDSGETVKRAALQVWRVRQSLPEVRSACPDRPDLRRSLYELETMLTETLDTLKGQ